MRESERPCYPESCDKQQGWQGLSAIIVYVSGLSSKTYVEDPSRILTRFEECPLTKDAHPLVRNGGYKRWFWLGEREDTADVHRKWCRPCRVSFTLLPADVLAHWQYPREFVEAWLWDAVHATPCRSREFLVTQGVAVPEPDPDTPWDDQRTEAAIRPSHHVLARWTRVFSARAARLIPLMTAMCVLLGLELKSAADAVSELRMTRPHLNALPVALGLLHVLDRALAPDMPCCLQDSLSVLVTHLARSRLPSSHGVVRASGARLSYDSLIT